MHVKDGLKLEILCQHTSSAWHPCLLSRLAKHENVEKSCLDEKLDCLLIPALLREASLREQCRDELPSCPQCITSLVYVGF